MADPIPFAESPKAAPSPSPKPKRPATPEQPPWPPPENSSRRWLLFIVVVAILTGYGFVLASYYAGAQGGVDQAGYLMTARLIAGEKNLDGPPSPARPSEATADSPQPSSAQTAPMFDAIRNRLSFVPESPFQFASRMCVMTEPFGPADPAKPAEYRVYAKYPFGYPLLAAIARKIGGWSAMYMVNPICTMIACLAAYFLFRQVVSPFMSVLGVLWLECNPLVLFYANDANSHSSALMCSVVGFWGLLSWMRTKQMWRAWIGGFALGYACTIRYSEFLLVLPVVFAAAIHLVGGKWSFKRLMGSLSLVAAWAIPVGTLALVCWISFGAPWKTGYSYCKESTGFGWKYLTGDFGDPNTHHTGNWETFIQQINHTALFIFWGPALVGLLAMLGSCWRLGVTIALWILPQTLLYMLYYWAPGGETSVHYKRFFMTLMPGFILAALWGIEQCLARLPGQRRPALVVITVFGGLVLLVAAMYLNGEPVKNGWALAGQMLWAIGHMVVTWAGLGMTLVIGFLIFGIWWWDREQAAAKTGMALAAGVITAVGCGVNLFNITPQVEVLYTQSVGLSDTIRNTQTLLPAGSVLFGDDQLLNQMDCVGGWKLVNARIFSQLSFHDSLRRYQIVDKDNDNEEDPDPIQRERSQFYMELLGKKNSAGQWISKSQDELLRNENELIDHYFAEGRRVAFLVQEREIRSKANGRATVPMRKDYEMKELGRWVTQPAVTGSTLIPGRMGRMGGNAPPRGGMVMPGGKFGGCFVLYELVPKKPKEPVTVPPVDDHQGELFPNVPAQK